MSYISSSSILSLIKFPLIRLHSFRLYRVLMIILISLCYAPTEVEAQNSGIICTHYNVNNGLTTNIVEYVFVDSEGYVWFATATGLQQFDGFNFVNYLYSSNDSLSISYNFISTISEDKKGNIWIGTLRTGLDIFSKEKGIFYHLSNKSEDSQILTSNIIPRGRKVVAQDSQGFLWINTLMGLNKINVETRSVEQFKGDLAGDVIFDQELGVLWIVSDRINKFNTETKKIEHFYINEEVLPGITNIVADSFNHKIRKINPDGIVSTLAGSTPGNVDGPGSSAQFAHLLGITMDAGGAIYLAQSDGPIRKIVIH